MTVNQCSSQFEVALFNACFCLAFFGALRIIELVCPSRSWLCGLLKDNVVIANGAIRIRCSKTDGYSRGEWILLHNVNGPACPVWSVSEYLSFRMGGKYFLSHVYGPPITRFQFQTVFKLVCSRGLAKRLWFAFILDSGATEASRPSLSNAEVQRIDR